MISTNATGTVLLFFQPELVRYWGYVCEEHFVTTADGYVLGIHRVPHGKGEEGSNVAKQPVLLAHGMLSSSAQWIFGPPENSLGFLLADEGTVRI